MPVMTKKKRGRPAMFEGRRDAQYPPFQTFPEVEAAAKRLRAETGMSLALIAHAALIQYLQGKGYLKPSNGAGG